MRTRDQDCWSFSCEGIEGANLLDAYEGKLRGLDGKEDLLFPADFVKVTFLVAVRRNLSGTAFVSGLLTKSADSWV